jgi:hypothetical protein
VAGDELTQDAHVPGSGCCQIDRPGLTYLGLYGDAETGRWHTWAPQDWSAHAGGDPATLPPVKVTAEREDKSVIYRREVWTGEGPPGPCVIRQLDREPEGIAAHPEPAVDSRTAAAGGSVHPQYPSAVLRLAEEALEAGWQVHRQYARGRTAHATTGKPLAERDSFALVFHGHPMTDRGAYAVHRGGAWDSVNVGGVMAAGVTELRWWLLAGGQEDPLRAAHGEALLEEAARKKRAAPKKVASSKKEGLR